MAVGVLLARPRSRRSAACRRSSSAGRPGSALPWWATLSTSTGSSGSGAVTPLSASAASSIENRPASSRATSALSFGLPLARQPGGAGRRPQDLEPQAAEREHLARGGHVRLGVCASRALHRGRPAGAAVDHEPRLRTPRSPAAPRPRGRPRRGSGSARRAGRCPPPRGARRIGPSDTPVSISTDVRPRWISVASPWPTSRNETTTSPRGAATGAPRPGATSERDGADARATTTQRSGDAVRRGRVRARDSSRRSARPAAATRAAQRDGDHERRGGRRSTAANGAAAVWCATRWT